MEIWKNIEGFGGDYQISNFGRCRSFKKGSNKYKVGNEPYIFVGSEIDGYMHYHLDGKSYEAHLLVWDHFGDESRDGRKLQVDHIKDKNNNHIDNLQLLTNRENTTKYFKSKKHTSKYTGVFWENGRNKWKSSIYINGKNITKRFDTEYEAHLDYQQKLNNINGK